MDGHMQGVLPSQQGIDLAWRKVALATGQTINHKISLPQESIIPPPADDDQQHHYLMMMQCIFIMLRTLKNTKYKSLTFAHKILSFALALIFLFRLHIHKINVLFVLYKSLATARLVISSLKALLYLSCPTLAQNAHNADDVNFSKIFQFHLHDFGDFAITARCCCYHFIISQKRFKHFQIK